jgi:hypothetical protein
MRAVCVRARVCVCVCVCARARINWEEQQTQDNLRQPTLVESKYMMMIMMMIESDWNVLFSVYFETTAESEM